LQQQINLIRRFLSNVQTPDSVITLTAVVIETVDEIYLEHEIYFLAFEIVSVAIFSAEYLTRVWVCVENTIEGYHHPIRGRLRYVLTVMALIDLISILPFFLGFFFAADLRFMRVFRLLRLLKLTRYSPAIETFGAVISSQRRPLTATLVIILMLLIFSSSVVFLFEHVAQPEKFGSIPQAMWWSVATLTTVGYGDVTPITIGGRIFGGFIMILGLGMFALPAGILASGFATEFQRRDFVVNWRLVAAGPLFQSLDALKISQIVNLLHTKIVPPAYILFQKGEPADAMYFIISGEIVIRSHPTVHLRDGEHFGEIALLKKSERVATVLAVTECRLLALYAEDFEDLLSDVPELRSAIIDTVESRLTELEEHKKKT
jgi:voltage-gated potassium channel